jgi:hypothetical protein
MSQELEERFFSVKFARVPYQIYAYGIDSLTAISSAREELGHEGLGGALVRPAVYKEWDYGPEHYTNGGDFIRDTSKPCRECGTPVPFHTHREELGFCQPCQSAYFDEEANE